MAQAFITTYNNSYRWHEIDKRYSLKQVDKLAETLPDGDIWIIPKKIGEDDEEGKQGMAAAEAAINRMIRKRLWSTYQVSYCKDMLPKREEVSEGASKSLDSALLAYCRTLYEPEKKMIPPPLPSARRIYGYMRPTNMYMPLSTYQTDLGTVAFHILDHKSHKQVVAPDVAPKTDDAQQENVSQTQVKEVKSKHKKKSKKNNNNTTNTRTCKCF